MHDSDRRNFLRAAGAAALTTGVFTGRLRGANDKTRVGFIGMGKMGRSNLGFALRTENVEVPAVCDVFDRNLDWAVEITKKNAPTPAKPFKDFREILDDKSIDAICIATPDHWHAYMTVEACKAGKDVYVEKPVSVTIDEGKKMVEAARKYNRVVQAGTMQRSAPHFQQAAEMVRSGQLGRITFVRTWNYANSSPEGHGNPPDTTPPPGLNWDAWLGPAPEHEFNANRFGVDPNDRYYSTFRGFWDYAGGMMTDWGVHLLDIVQLAFDETMPLTVSGFGERYYIKDNQEVPDTLVVSYEYPGFLATYENREANGQSMFGHGYGILFMGTKGTLFVDRAGYQLVPENNSGLKAAEVKSTSSGNREHWANFIECIHTRARPTSDIEKCLRSTATCLLGNIAIRSKMRLDWDAGQMTIVQNEGRRWMSRPERAPWKIVV
jgi:predicted dehydrogenase